jgi:hypothetical protein
MIWGPTRQGIKEKKKKWKEKRGNAGLDHCLAGWTDLA